MLLAVQHRLQRLVEALAGTKRWTLWTALVAFGGGFFLASSNLARFVVSSQWDYTIVHSRGDLFDPSTGPLSREANLTFRFVPRLVGKVLQFSEPQHFVALHMVLGIVALMVIARLTEEALGDRSIAVVATLGSAGLWAVAGSWADLQGNFDTAALLLVLTAMLVRRPPLVLLAGVAASFTDERSLLVLPLVAGWHLLRDDGLHGHSADTGGRQPLGPSRLAAAAAIGAGMVHVIVRLALRQRYGLSEGRNRSPGNPWAQLNNYPNGWWGALEGYWFVAFAGWIALVQAGRRWIAAASAASVLVTLFVGMTVFDISRSVMFAFAMVPLALLALRQADRAWTRGLVWIAAATSLIWPLIYAADDRTVVWVFPLPLLLLDNLLNG